MQSGLCHFIVLCVVNAAALESSLQDKTQDAMDNLVNKLSDRLIEGLSKRLLKGASVDHSYVDHDDMTLGKPCQSVSSPSFSSGRSGSLLSARHAFRAPHLAAAGLSTGRHTNAFPRIPIMGGWQNYHVPDFTANPNFARMINVAAEAQSAGMVSLELGAQEADKQEIYNQGANEVPYSLVTERDACGVGFIASKTGQRRHDIVSKSIRGLSCMEHRGGCSADSDSGDGAGVMTSIPWELYLSESGNEKLKEAVEDGVDVGVGMVFLPQEPDKVQKAKSLIESTCAQGGFTFLGWREVPTAPDMLGPLARDVMPTVAQFFVKSSTNYDQCTLHPGALMCEEAELFEQSLYTLRRTVPDVFAANDAFDLSSEVYFCSLSSRTIVYKAMVRSEILAKFYKDLENPEYKSKFCIYHRRFSTNTQPKWPLAQPMRMMGHNGEINTLLGNINSFRVREKSLINETSFPVDFLKKYNLKDSSSKNYLEPIVDNGKSDTANLDSAFELLVKAGVQPQEALQRLVPEAYMSNPDPADRINAFFEYHASQQEAWDGPALMMFSDGKVVGSKLDRNGLRPARYAITDDLVYIMSETGAIEVDDKETLSKGRLGPGQMILVDLEKGEFMSDIDIKNEISSAYPYEKWMKEAAVYLHKEPFSDKGEDIDLASLLKEQTKFGWGFEDMSMVIPDMASAGKEAIFSMGDDAPLAVLSAKPRLLYDYFKQRFAQVTNPAIDPYREGAVMSLQINLGAKRSLLVPSEEGARMIHLDSPILNDAEFATIMNVDEGRPADQRFKPGVLRTTYSAQDGPKGLANAIKALCASAIAQVNEGSEILVLSDKNQESDDEDSIFIPPLLAVGAVHQALVREGLRGRTSLIAQTGQCWSTHHYACLIGFGAEAVHPYMAYNAVSQWFPNSRFSKEMSVNDALKNYRTAAENGILKILSKMGISLLTSYMGAQIFEAIGLGEEVMALAFTGTPSMIGGMTIEDLANENAMFASYATDHEGDRKKLENYGFNKVVKKGGEFHHNTPDLSKLLHKAIRGDKDIDMYNLFAEEVRSRPITTLRDLLDIKSDREPIPLEDVESEAEIMKRFCTGGMSLGALSREMHETLAIAMNRIGGRSNSGEGGEDVLRFKPIEDVTEVPMQGKGNENKTVMKSASFSHLNGVVNGDTAISKVKQVASGRFGVTPEYLMSAEQLEIKLAQGAKPGEGGQLPGPKVTEYIASVRASKPGVTLISPPPHHDIYSIEDLGQLIHDLHAVNPKAKVSVKLVGQIGIGTVAAGVAKCDADIIQISGHDGGTGASPLSSIKHTGGPWELGLAEVHRTLLNFGLRERSVLRVDGGFKTGWEVVISSLMGAEEYGFGTVAMIAGGCVMARVCHTNGCPVGVATQREDLRKKFPGTPEEIVTYFSYVATEVRMLLAHMGYKSLDDVIGRGDLLVRKTGDYFKVPKTEHVNLDAITTMLPDTKENRAWLQHPEEPHSTTTLMDDDTLLANKDILSAIDSNTPESIVTLAGKASIPADNEYRSTGARLSGVIAAKHGNYGFHGALNLHLHGYVGQSFGAFNIQGVNWVVTGEANDYLGKSMNGGEIVLKPSQTFQDEQASKSVYVGDNIILGNTALYGATGGKLFAYGGAGERFGVRNSGCVAVVENVGDHACEYMTGGVIVCLGKTGKNIGAGMTGGLAFFYEGETEDLEGFERRVNKDVRIGRVCSSAGQAYLKDLLTKHVEKTGSKKAQNILDNFKTEVSRFRQVVPPSEEENIYVIPDLPDSAECSSLVQERSAAAQKVR
eukprot:gnl/MRDRNA2_/MRDRNA2_102258_c0_seq1.p1 gnl/MRDRNA2_/MRDRNA2_102258_c0~~gnl/MRDRNA2_/MRDRNA2_102258_c0_seq1.p1  ORF type:complete len:1776 (-),score=315.85 gnl/MRDRNA2_/MRDRNA2_102258_c0_seq1:378-5705(-)